ncbi:hypothetical protein [Leptospira mayottensis]|uniref:Uncharacterized protein n=2 Tax=Leptospira mayottensis TaxID=1137606 RepID=A0AA87SZR6_9LEPT|nr:hypothetical protein [Leptospira mayottensis]AXR59408.1 hypothetical protein DQM68_00375 [Leptospira mayottensis]AXR63191.1 hypothetical protein DQM28_02010 [Leptospira mayottensis]AZQ01278.1 hypothetical protein LEP1GSC190_03620 [Leptospira mayottensis 200901116]EKS01192.1 hypothetical protein LEP1GSC125_1209 [Leptospira mayottensis 200901122]TGN14158.1 hypothetical protein EHR03_04145 [Leptospira mayottensis]
MLRLKKDILVFRDESKADWKTLRAISKETHRGNSPDYHKDMWGFIESKIFGFEISKKSYQFFRSLDRKLDTNMMYSYRSKN